MHPKRRQFLTVLLTLLMLMSLLAGIGLAATPTAAAPAPIKLKATTFTPTLGEKPDIPLSLATAEPAADQRGYYIVQFAGPVQQAWKDQVTEAGAELLDYIPDFAFKVRMSPAQAQQVEKLGSVAWVGLFQPAYKLSPQLDREGLNLVRVRVERGANAGLAAAAIARSGAQVLGRESNLLVVGASPAQLEAIARVNDVAWVEAYLPYEKHNEYGAGVIVGANTAHANGYDGSTQIAAVSDTGLGDGTAAGAHADIPAERIVSIHNWPGAPDGCFSSITDDGAIDVASGHGTHTALSVLGDGGANGEGKGAAPAARLVFQATENWAKTSTFCQLFGGWPENGYFLTGIPVDLGQMYQQAYDDGARIHSNSWGNAQAGVYSTASAYTDDFIWTHPDMTITFSAGNAGTDANNDGVVDNDSIGSPATAKNVIAVGASENDRQGHYECDNSLGYTSHDAYQAGETCSSMGGLNLLGTAGQRWEGFTTEPLSSDLTAGNAEQMAAFSSRGPTDDGRIKPDVVAPGTWVLSGFSGLYQEGYGDPTNPQNDAYQYDGWGMPINESYKYMGGTSMSNPIAAGAATVVRDYYQKAHSHGASAALVKATLINSAVDLLDENNDGADDNDYPIPNVHEGWGRVNLANATDGSHQYVDGANVSTGGSASYQYGIASAGQPFKVSLVWSDYPSSETAAQNLVNDLDLVVTAPDGGQYRGNVFSGGWSQTGSSADRTNNVENVYVQAAAAGTWTVQVSGFNVPNGPQPFALVVDGDFGTAPTPTNTPVTPEPTPTVSPEPATSMHIGDLDGAAASAGKNWEAQVTITVHDSNHNPVADATVNGSWSGDTPGTGQCTTDASGVCSVTSPLMAKKSTNSAIFTVTGASHASLAYVKGDNHDPDGDSSGTAIQVNKDGTTSNPGSPTPTPTPGPGIVMHVGDLDGSGTVAPRSRWDATVTITVHDASDSPVEGATVFGTWSVGGEGSCPTDAAGQCSVTKTNIKSNEASTDFTVTGITRDAGDSYNPGANDDPDGDSDGTTITILQP